MLDCDHNTFQQFYKNIIIPVVKEYKTEYSQLILLRDAEQIIWKNYVKFNKHCKEEYMESEEDVLDRHKVSACYIYAVIRSNVLRSATTLDLPDDMSIKYNERLALCLGMTILRSMIVTDIKKKLSEGEVKEKALVAYKGELSFPKSNHGTFIDNLMAQLYHTKREGNYNILALSETMYLVECYNMIINGLPEDLLSAK